MRAGMEPRKTPPEYFLEIFADTANVRDVLKGKCPHAIYPSMGYIPVSPSSALLSRPVSLTNLPHLPRRPTPHFLPPVLPQYPIP